MLWNIVKFTRERAQITRIRRKTRLASIFPSKRAHPTGRRSPAIDCKKILSADRVNQAPINASECNSPSAWGVWNHLEHLHSCKYIKGLTSGKPDVTKSTKFTRVYAIEYKGYVGSESWSTDAKAGDNLVRDLSQSPTSPLRSLEHWRRWVDVCVDLSFRKGFLASARPRRMHNDAQDGINTSCKQIACGSSTRSSRKERGLDIKALNGIAYAPHSSLIVRRQGKPLLTIGPLSSHSPAPGVGWQGWRMFQLLKNDHISDQSFKAKWDSLNLAHLSRSTGFS